MAVNWVSVAVAIVGVLATLGGLFAFVNEFKNQLAVTQQRVLATEKRIDKCEASSETYKVSVADEFKASRRELNESLDRFSTKIDKLTELVITSISQKKN